MLTSSKRYLLSLPTFEGIFSFSGGFFFHKKHFIHSTELSLFFMKQQLIMNLAGEPRGSRVHKAVTKSPKEFTEYKLSNNAVGLKASKDVHGKL